MYYTNWLGENDRMGTKKDSEKTKAKIIKAAGQLFAQKGFKGVTVREIAKDAKTHLGALNYHFSSKKDLYREVLLEACKKTSISPEEQQLLLQMDQSEALRIIIRELIKSYDKETTSYWQTIIITRKCWEPSFLFEEIMEEYLKSYADYLAKIIGGIVDKPADDDQVRFSTIALVGLLDTFGIYGRFVEATAPGLSKKLKKDNLLEDQIFHMVTLAAKDHPTK
jgi:TetR/AcrR family transcriptional regulator, regulator of cefoperazone and chloramphenicol sensitivity